MKKLLVLLAVVALAGCGTVSGIFGGKPDPRMAENYRDMMHFAKNDTDPTEAERKAEALRRAKELADEQSAKSSGSTPPIDAPEVLTGIGALFGTIPGLTAIGGILTAAGAAWAAISGNRRSAAAIDQHAALIDGVTPESADFAAKIGAKPPAAGPSTV